AHQPTWTLILLFLPDIKTIRIVSSHEFPYDISALGWARPFHQIFEKGPNLVFDGRHGDRLRFYDCLPSRCKHWARMVRVAQTMSLRGDAIRQAKLGQTKSSGPTGLEMRRPFLRKETRKRKSYAIDRPFRSDFESIGLSFFLTLGGALSLIYQWKDIRAWRDKES
ncbi:hypothetical protein Gotur_007190, partial [Gossypium turneri]